MGCDIHFYVETRQADGSWKTADKWTTEPGDPADRYVPFKDEFYGERNYNLFSILADVRNGYGFAGAPTGAGFKPIAQPRGLPPDVCEDVKQRFEAWGEDAHSASHFTVAELMAYDWTQTTTLSGMVTPLEFMRLKLDGKPGSWSGAIWGARIEHVTPEEMEQKLLAHFVSDRLTWPLYHQLSKMWSDEEAPAELKHTYTRVEWPRTYYQCAGTFLSETMPRLWALGPFEGVRIVFWFDN